MSAVAALQMNSGDDVAANLAAAARLVEAAAASGAVLAALPENFAFMGGHEAAKLAHAEPDGSGRIQDFLSDCARRHRIWIVAGTMPMAVPGDPERVHAASLVYDDAGRRVARYDKIHLFDVEVERDGRMERYHESRHIARGHWNPVVVDTPAGRVGLSVCYDLRFPELFRSLVAQGAELLCVPAAFTARTGEAHWDVLQRARAVENLCYVIAPAQYGTHPGGRSTWGHSMVVDPWGTVLACEASGESAVIARVDRQRQAQLRASFPALSHRRASASS
ncbi:MAG: carbon-nitrogen family hydrolase [Panacagrimonas sp.]|nr:carbon-nitrogen hydrolase family protein [Panacagrimonas sp.]MCC2655495.1 carbon-nitrogen family hydrolase [Panacagrimonas sp.]